MSSSLYQTVNICWTCGTSCSVPSCTALVYHWMVLYRDHKIYVLLQKHCFFSGYRSHICTIVHFHLIDNKLLMCSPAKEVRNIVTIAQLTDGISTNSDKSLPFKNSALVGLPCMIRKKHCMDLNYKLQNLPWPLFIHSQLRTYIIYQLNNSGL